MSDPTTINDVTVTLEEAQGIDIAAVDMAEIEVRAVAADQDTVSEAMKQADALTQDDPVLMTPLSKTVFFLKSAYPDRSEAITQVQFGVHFEEIAEMLDAMDSKDYTTTDLIMDAKGSIDALAKHLKSGVDAMIVADDTELLDALADQMVTAISVGLNRGYDIIGAFDAVGDSNLSKFVDGKPIFADNGKIAKGPNYVKVDLTPFLPKPVA